MLNSSGPISLGGSTTGQSINLELSQASTTTVSLNDTNVRSLAGVSSGAISMPTNFWGKSAGPVYWYRSTQNTGAISAGPVPVGINVDSSENVYTGGSWGYSSNISYSTSFVNKQATAGGITWVAELYKSNENVFTTGFYADSSGNSYSLMSNNTSSVAYVVKVNSSGSLVWATKIQKSGVSISPSYGVSIDVVGTGVWVAVYDTTNVRVSLVKLSASSGTLQWQRELSGDSNLAIARCSLLVLSTGVATMYIGATNATYGGGIYFMTYDTNGTLQTVGTTNFYGFGTGTTFNSGSPHISLALDSTRTTGYYCVPFYTPGTSTQSFNIGVAGSWAKEVHLSAYPTLSSITGITVDTSGNLYASATFYPSGGGSGYLKFNSSGTLTAQYSSTTYGTAASGQCEWANSTLYLGASTYASGNKRFSTIKTEDDGTNYSASSAYVATPLGATLYAATLTDAAGSLTVLPTVDITLLYSTTGIGGTASSLNYLS